MADLTQKQYLDLTGLKVYDEKIKAYVDATDATLDAAIKGVNGDLTAEIANRAAGDKAINDIIGDWKSFDDTLTITDAINQLAGDDGVLHGIQDAIDAVDAKVGDTTKLGDLGNTVDAILAVADVIGNQDNLAKATVIESINANADAIEAEVARAKAAEQANADAIAAINNGESGVLASAKAYTDTKVGEEQTRAEAAEKALGDRIDAHVAAVDGKVATLVGTDEGKSVRTIANEELAAQLLSGEADADFKTLQELAAWLEAHPESVAEMNADIAANAQDIADLKAAVGEGGSVDTQIDAKINALDADITSAEVEAGKGIRVQVVEADGKITNVAVTGNYDNRYDAKGDASLAQAAAEATANEYATQAESNAKSYTDTELAKVYGAMASIPNSEIEALFA